MLSDKTKSGDFEWPNTTTDMELLEEWKHGQKIYGTFALAHKGFREYREDINKAWGKENNYKKNTVYVNTLKALGPQLKKYGG